MENAAGDLHPDHSPGGLFVFHEYVPTLQNIASHEVALRLWNDYISRSRSKKIREKTPNQIRAAFGLNKNYKLESDKLIESLRTPRLIEEMLKESLAHTRNEMEYWIYHFEDEIFKEGWKKYCPRNFDPNLLVWHQNGKINYKRSASIMVSEGKLEEAQKFIIMCSFGMADEIKQFPMCLLPEDFNRRSFFNFEITYWISHQRDEVCRVLQELSVVLRGEDTSIDVILAKLCGNRSLPYAFEYFWNRLNEDEQISVAIRLLPESWELQKIILSKMPSSLQRQLVDEIGVDLMVNFCVGLDMPENAFTIWKLIRDRITEQKFADLLINVFDDVICSENCMIMLIDIWDTAPDNLKRYAVETDAEFIFEAFTYNVKHSPSSYKFFIKFLSMVNKRTRKRMILSEDADMLVESVDDHNIMMDILNLCVPEQTDQLQFKNLIMKSSVMEAYCVKLLNDLEFAKLMDKLMFYSPSLCLTQEFVRKLLKSDDLYTKIFILDCGKWNKLSLFIDSAFPNDLSTTSQLKKELVSSFSTNAVHCWDQSENFNELVKVTEQVFSTDEINVFKETLLKHFRKMISSNQFWRRFEGKCFHTFVSWCSVDENEVTDFKNIIPADEFFDDMFDNICAWYVINGETYEPQYSLNELDAFLRYFCASDEEVKLFKMRKFNEYDQFWFREVWQNSNDRAWLTILTWFFENDQEQIGKFLVDEVEIPRKPRMFNLMECCR